MVKIRTRGRITLQLTLGLASLGLDEYCLNICLSTAGPVRRNAIWLFVVNFIIIFLIGLQLPAGRHKSSKAATAICKQFYSKIQLMVQDSENSLWKTSCNRYVGFIDIMGFKDLVLRLPHEQIYEMMLKIEESKNTYENLYWGKIKRKLVRTTTYSDSIMIYSKDDSFDSLYSFTCTISAIIEDLFLETIPFKGAVAFGTMTLDTEKSIFFGQPLIDSYLLQEELSFYGVIIHASAEKEMKKHGKELGRLFLSNYLCPLKNGTSYHLTISPMSADNDLQETEEDIDDYEKLLKAIDKLRERTSGHLRKYIDNTETYLNFVRKTIVAE